MLALLTIGGALRLALLFRIPPLFMQGDSQSFLLPGYDLAHGLGFEPIIKRTLGYPLLIASVMAVSGEELRALVFVQALLGLGTVIATYWIGRLAYGRAAGLLAGLLVAIGGQLLIYEHYVLAESVFAFFLSLGVLGAIAAVASGWRSAALSGAALAAATLFRPIAEVVVPLSAVLYLFAVRPRGRALRLFGSVVVGFLLLLLPATFLDVAMRGGSSSGAIGEHLLWRLTRSDSGYVTRADVANYPPESAQAYAARRAADRMLPQEIYEGLRTDHGLNPGQADAAMFDVARDAIGRQPIQYVVSTVRMAGELFFGMDQRLGDVAKRDGEARYSNPQSKQRTWFEDRILHLAEPPTESVRNEFDRAELLTSIYQPARYAPLLAILSLAGLVLAIVGRPSRLGLLPALTILAMLVVNAAIAGPEARFRYPIDPLIGVVAAGGLFGLLDLARAASWDRSDSRSRGRLAPPAAGVARTSRHATRRDAEAMNSST